MIWNFLNNITSNLITMAVFIFLTYRLEAAVFGIFALGVIIVDYFNFQARSACLDATLQRRAFSKAEMDSNFWAMMGVTVCVIVVCAFAGAWLADVNDEPSLTYVMLALALTLLPVPLGVPPNAMMMRDLDFRGGAIRGIVGALAGGAAAIVVVMSPFAEWALVAQRGTQVTVAAVIMAMRTKWFPGFHFDPQVSLPFLKDAGRIFTAQAIGSSQMRLLDLIVAFGFGIAAVGFMRVANRFVEVVLGTFMAPISSLWVVLLSAAGAHVGERDLIYRRLSQMSALITVPVFAGIALTSEEIVAITLSADYAPVAPMLIMMCVAGLFAPLTYFRNAALIAVKRLNLLITFSVLDLVVIFVAAFAVLHVSALAALASLVVLEVARLGMTIPILLRDMRTRAVDLFLAVMPAYAACAVMAGAVMLIHVQTPDMVPLLRLGLKATAGACAFVGYLLIFHRDWSMTGLKMLTPSGRAAPLASATA